MRRVVKFGGTSVGNAERVRLAAKSVAELAKKGDRVVVVVSAMGETTDELLDLIENVTDKNASIQDKVTVMSVGEMASARLMASALKALGINSKYLDPYCPEWTIITESLKKDGSADLIFSEAKRRADHYLVPMLEQGIIPVVCGFLGRDIEGNITTLGRGGSDTTAFIIANAVNAEEVIIVTDVDGVFSADPRQLEKTKMIEKIDVDSMSILAKQGAKVLHPNALRYKTSQMKAKIIHFKYGDLSAPGTEIIGESGTKLEMLDKKLSLIVVVGENFCEQIGLIKKIISPLSDQSISIYNISMSDASIGLYVENSVGKKAFEIIHQIVLNDHTLHSITLKENIAMLILKSFDFIETPGIIAHITTPLSQAGINILEIITLKSDIMIFIDWEDRDDVFQILKEKVVNYG